MKVAVVSCVYPPEPVVSARTSADVVNALHAAGDEPIVICPFPSRPYGRIHDGFRRRWHARSSDAGVAMIRCASIVSRSSTLLSRLFENVSFGLSSATALLFVRRPNAIFLNSWPLFATGMASLVARLKRAPYVVSVQDVYPESLLVQGRMAARVLAPPLRAMDRWIARGAAAVIVLSRDFAEMYRDDRGVAPERIHVIPNWSTEEHRASDDAVHSYRHGLGVADDEFLVVFGGNVGVAAGVEQLIEAIGRTGDPRIRLVVAGDGARASACEALARSAAPGRIRFHRPWREEETAVVLGAADLLALPTAGQQSRISVPSKLISYMLAGKPVLAAVSDDSETARIVNDSGGGWTVAPDVQQVADALVRAAAADPLVLAGMGQRARSYALEHFGRDRCLNRVFEILRSVSR